MDKQPVFTPWQVAVSEAHRDGEAAQAIKAWRLRGPLHLCYDEEKTLRRLVDDWARQAQASPVVPARTRDEARALSWLMRERVLAHMPDAKRAVIQVSRDVDGRVTEPLEVAVGDRLRIGATHWEKQLFNDTVVTVEGIDMQALKVRSGEHVAVARAFWQAVWLIECEIDRLQITQGDRSSLGGGSTGWPSHSVWESLKTASHFKFSIALELRMKCLPRLHDIAPLQGRSGHCLAQLYDQVGVVGSFTEARLGQSCF